MFEKARRKRMEKVRSKSTRPVVYEQDLKGYLKDQYNIESRISKEGLIERRPVSSKMSDEEYKANNDFNYDLNKVYSGVYMLIDSDEPLAFRYRHIANYFVTLADAWRVTHPYSYDETTVRKKYRGLDTMVKGLGLEMQVSSMDREHKNIIVDFTKGTSEAGWMEQKHHIRSGYAPNLKEVSLGGKLYYYETEKVPGNDGVLPVEVRPVEIHRDYPIKDGYGGMKPVFDNSTTSLEEAKRYAKAKAENEEFRSSVSDNRYSVTTIVKQTDDKGFWDALRDVLPWDLKEDQKKVYEEKFKSLKVGESLLVPMWGEYTDYKGNVKKIGKNGYAEIVRTASKKRR